ncbi:hypothetical protein L6452_20480 [Arctium lappa]|uniref:Uncharacterized protein n=1 Tax=Arctium lappa TaxID=4217 RepID=A0ACB9BBX2_ARCLA|nr:hypothetical protein L6452_20480 [Arctium lappa]
MTTHASRPVFVVDSGSSFTYASKTRFSTTTTTTPTITTDDTSTTMHRLQKPSPPRHRRHLHHEDSPAQIRSQSTRLRRPSTLIENQKAKRCLRIGTDQNRMCITEGIDVDLWVMSPPLSSPSFSSDEEFQFDITVYH